MLQSEVRPGVGPGTWPWGVKHACDSACVPQYVAKLSADNVVLMVKLNKAESRRDALAAESADLRAAVDTQSGPWFEEVHAAVEAAQRESMKRADSLQVRAGQHAGAHAYLTLCGGRGGGIVPAAR